MYRGHILGPVVRQLRQMARENQSSMAMMDYLARHTPETFLAQGYLRAAFDLSLTLVMNAVPAAAPNSRTESLDRKIRDCRPSWESQRFPELMRLRDYLSFIDFAISERIIVVVCSSNPWSARYVGRPGYRSYGGDTFVVTAESGPCAGLAIADPGDPKLASSLATFAEPLSYASYVDRLQTTGYRVLGPSDQYVIEDGWGNRFYEGYRLHGAYDAGSGEPVWSGKRGPRLLATINRLLGAELVLDGPHDDWEHRNDKAVAGPLWGPHAPCMEFKPDGTIHNLLDLSDMALYGSQSDHWRRLYPEHLHLLDDQGDGS